METKMPFAEDWEKFMRIAKKYAEDVGLNFKEKYPQILKKGLEGILSSENSEQVRAGNDIQLLRDMLWLSYGLDLGKIVPEIKGFKANDKIAKSDFERLIKDVLNPNFPTLRGMFDDIYFHPEVAEAYKAGIKTKIETETDPLEKEGLKSILDNIDKIIETDKTVMKEGKNVESKSNGWYSLRKLKDFIGKEINGFTIGDKDMVDIAKGMFDSFIEISSKKGGQTGYLSSGMILDGTDPYEDMAREEIEKNSGSWDAVKDWLSSVLAEYLKIAKANELIDAWLKKFLENNKPERVVSYAEFNEFKEKTDNSIHSITDVLDQLRKRIPDDFEMLLRNIREDYQEIKKMLKSGTGASVSSKILADLEEKINQKADKHEHPYAPVNHGHKELEEAIAKKADNHSHLYAPENHNHRSLEEKIDDLKKQFGSISKISNEEIDKLIANAIGKLKPGLSKEEIAKLIADELKPVYGEIGALKALAAGSSKGLDDETKALIKALIESKSREPDYAAILNPFLARLSDALKGMPVGEKVDYDRIAGIFRAAFAGAKPIDYTPVIKEGFEAIKDILKTVGDSRTHDIDYVRFAEALKGAFNITITNNPSYGDVGSNVANGTGSNNGNCQPSATNPDYLKQMLEALVTTLNQKQQPVAAPAPIPAANPEIEKLQNNYNNLEKELADFKKELSGKEPAGKKDAAPKNATDVKPEKDSESEESKPEEKKESKKLEAEIPVNGKGIEKYYEASDKAKRLVNGLYRMLREAYMSAEEDIVSDNGRGVDLSKLKDNKILSTFESKIYASLLGNAKAAYGTKIEDMFIESDIMNALVGFDKSFIREATESYKENLDFEHFIQESGKASKYKVRRTLQLPQTCIDKSHAKDVVAHTGTKGKVDPDKLNTADIVSLLDTYKQLGIVPEKTIQDKPYYTKQEIKKAA
jgi:hypothetical protein